MNKLLNKEFRLSIVNILALEEHLLEMMSLTNDEKVQKELFSQLKENKEKRNKMLSNNSSEIERSKDFNKWCAIKHLMLSQYHLMEYLNQNDKTYDDVKNLFKIIEELDLSIDKLLKTKFDGNCGICTDDLIITKMGKSVKEFFKKG